MGRKAAHRAEVSALYTRDYSHDPALCAYCGAPRQCLDHVPPLRLAADMDLDRFRRNGGELLLIPACLDCNALLGSKPLPTYDERLSALYWLYEARIRSRSWSEDEVAELGPGLRRYVEGQDARNRELIAKFRGIERAILRCGRPV